MSTREARNAAKRRYNDKTYARVAFSMRKAPCREFKEKCKREGISQADVVRIGIRQFMGWDNDMDF